MDEVVEVFISGWFQLPGFARLRFKFCTSAGLSRPFDPDHAKPGAGAG